MKTTFSLLRIIPVATALALLTACDKKPQAVETTDPQVQSPRTTRNNGFPSSYPESSTASTKAPQIRESSELKGKTFTMENGNPIRVGETRLGPMTFLTDDMVGVIVDEQGRIVPGTYKLEGEELRMTLPIGVANTTLKIHYNREAERLEAPDGQNYNQVDGQIHMLRTQATKVINDARIFEAAVDQWAIENNKRNKDTYRFSDVSDYIKASSHLVQSGGKDVMGNPYVMGTVSDGIKVNPATFQHLKEITNEEFWGSYAPKQ